MLYDYECEKCELVQEISHGMTESPDIFCPECDGKMFKLISRNVNIVFKGMGWASKNLNEQKYRMQRRKEVGRKMALNHDIPQIQPNYKGQVCKDWGEAKKLAKADGVNTQRYDSQVQNLQKQQHQVKEKVSKLVKGEG